ISAIGWFTLVLALLMAWLLAKTAFGRNFYATGDNLQGARQLGVAIWGGPAYVPRWTSEKEMTRFMDLVFQHMADTAARLEDYPE
ncbi:hypothetical protein ONQ60_26715, partial [Salmonella enterica subsp. enterica serovar Virginia]|nr:hypothetical protein [Salmonella enterica subsp. enterica serovar Virginia]